MSWHREIVDSHVKVLKGDPILSVWAFEDGLKNIEIVPRKAPCFCTISNLEEDAELGAIYAREILLWCDGIHERLLVQIPAEERQNRG